MKKYYIGIDLGGTNIATAVVDEEGKILGRAKRKTKLPRPCEEIFEDMALCAKEAVENSDLTMDDIECVGIGTPGTIEQETGVIEYANNLGMRNAPVRDYMEKALGKKIYIENDANAAAWGEFLAGIGKDTNNMVMITLGTGVGGGIVENGRLLCGAYSKGAEIGHMVISMDGEACTCGRNGCFEAYASATALIRQTKRAMEENPDSKMWDIAKTLDEVDGRTAFSADDATAKTVVNNYLRYLSEGIVNVVNVLQPEIICIGGGIAGEGDKILGPINEAIDKFSYARHSKLQTVVKRAILGNDAGIIGAALLWKNER